MHSLEQICQVHDGDGGYIRRSRVLGSAWPTSGGRAGCRLWLALGWGERSMWDELTHGAVDSKQAGRQAVRGQGRRASESSKADPQVLALQYSTAHTHTTHQTPGANTVSAVIAPVPYAARTNTHTSGRRRQPCPASAEYIASYTTRPRRFDRSPCGHLFTPGR